MNWIRLINSTSIFKLDYSTPLKTSALSASVGKHHLVFLDLTAPVVIPTIPLYRKLPYTTKNQSDNMNI